MATPPETAQASSLDIRVEDFLDDKLQSAADLDALDELLASVETQRNQLQSQLDDAVQRLDEARHTAQSRQASLQERIHEFQQLQESIDERVQVAAASDAPSAAIARLQKPMKKLHAVDMAQKYLLLLQDVANLRAEALSHLPQSPKAALEPYARLKELALRLKSAPGSEHLHLLDHVERVVESLWDEMKTILSAELEAVLAERNWPRVDPQSEMDDEWLASVEKLIDLQMLEIAHSTCTLSLLPFDVMARIFVAEFRFHFLSDKPTSSLQAIATHCFPWFLATVEKWQCFFRDNLGHLLAAKLHHGPLSERIVYLDPACDFITSMLPVMREKVREVMVQAVDNPPFFSSFVSQLMALDDSIRSRFSYDGGDQVHGWPGLAAQVLDEHFDAWFKVERSFAMERFDKVMESQDARKIDYDYAVDGKMKPTLAAVRVTDLLRAVTAKYERLRKLKHKLRFLTDIQLDILDGYHDRLRGSLEAYQSMTSALGRSLHGATKEQVAALEGIGGLEALCKVVGSADHVGNTLAEWADEEFFAALWDELQARDAQRRGPSGAGHVADDEETPKRASSMLEHSGDDSGIFDETVAAYTRIRTGAEELLVAALAKSHAKALRAYMYKVQWTTTGDAAVSDDALQLSISPELDELLHVLRRNLDFLHRALSAASFRRVWRDALERLQDTLWNDVLLKQSFTSLGAAQFAHDGAAVCALVDGYMAGGSAALAALCDGTRLLGLPVDGGAGVVTLGQASDRAFTDNDEARRLLDDLQLKALTPLNARYILQRRVENGENIEW